MEPWNRKRTLPTPVDWQHKKIKKEETESILVTTLCKPSPFEFLKTIEKATEVPESTIQAELDNMVKDIFVEDLALSEDDDIKPKLKEEKNTRKSILISPQNKSKSVKVQCKYEYKKGPKKGMQCTQLANQELCALHSTQKKEKLDSKNNQINQLKEDNQRMGEKIRNLEKIINNFPTQEEVLDLKNKNKEMEEKIKKLEDNWGEVDSKFKKILEVLSKNDAVSKIDNLIKLARELENKTHVQAITKIQNLDKTKTFKLVKILGGNHAIISCSDETKKIKFPNSMAVPEQTDGQILKFNESNKKFEWLKE